MSWYIQVEGTASSPSRQGFYMISNAPPSHCENTAVSGVAVNSNETHLPSFHSGIKDITKECHIWTLTDSAGFRSGANALLMARI